MRLEHSAQLVDLGDVLGPVLAHERPAVVDRDDQALALELPQRLAERCPADAEIEGEYVLL